MFSTSLTLRNLDERNLFVTLHDVRLHGVVSMMQLMHVNG